MAVRCWLALCTGSFTSGNHENHFFKKVSREKRKTKKPEVNKKTTRLLRWYFSSNLTSLLKVIIMSDQAELYCFKCGRNPRSLMQCRDCKVSFCGQCFAPHQISPDQDIPEMISCCPKCNSGNIEYFE